jgi:hypothetical protein
LILGQRTIYFTEQHKTEPNEIYAKFCEIKAAFILTKKYKTGAQHIKAEVELNDLQIYLSFKYIYWVENSKNFGKLKKVENTISGRTYPNNEP